MQITIRHTGTDSNMAHFLGTGGMFEVYVNGELVPSVTLTDAEVTQIVTLHLLQIQLIQQTLNHMSQTPHSLSPGKRLVGAHKPLRTLPTSPHASPHAPVSPPRQ